MPTTLRAVLDVDIGANNTGLKVGVTSDERDRIKALERENKELRRANEILKLASAFFAQAAVGK